MRYPEIFEMNMEPSVLWHLLCCAIDRTGICFDSALQKFHDRGFATETGPNCYEGSGIGISNTPQKCG